MKRLKQKRFIACKQINRKIPDPCNAKEDYQSFIRKKNTKSVKQSEIITYQPKRFEKRNIVDIKSVITHHPKTSHKLSKTIRQAEKVDSNSSFYSDTKRSGNCFNEKNIKRTKRVHTFKGFPSFYNVEILDSFKPELQLEDTESAIKSKLIDLLTKLKGFKFVTTLVLVLVFKKIESEDKAKYDTFYSSSKPEIIINESDIDDVFESILQLYQTYKNL